MYKRNYLYGSIAGLIAATTLVGCGGGGGGGGGGANLGDAARTALGPLADHLTGDGDADTMNTPGYDSARQLSESRNPGAVGSMDSSVVTRSSDSTGAETFEVEMNEDSPDGWVYSLTFTEGGDSRTTLSSNSPGIERVFFVADTEDLGLDNPVHVVAMVRQEDPEPTSSMMSIDPSGEVTMAMIASDRAVPDSDAMEDDYLTLGFWAQVILPADGSVLMMDPISVGAFATGTPVEGKLPDSGTATYKGITSGIYEEIGVDFGAFSGEVELNADFGTPSISGTVSDLEFASALDDGSEVSYPDGIVVWLNSAPAMNGALASTPAAIVPDIADDGGSFDGDDVRIGGTDLDGAVSGEWGGQFFGAPDADTGQHTRVGGTWTVTAEPGSDDQGAYMFGAFGAGLVTPEDTPAP